MKVFKGNNHKVLVILERAGAAGEGYPITAFVYLEKWPTMNDATYMSSYEFEQAYSTCKGEELNEDERIALAYFLGGLHHALKDYR